MEDFKDITIGNRQFQIGKMTARNGSWVVAQLVTKMLPMGMEDKMPLDGQLSSKRQEMTEAEFHNVQDHCLRVCKLHQVVGEQDVAQDIMRSDGRFNFKELEYDAVTVLELTVAALMYNCSPFFSEGVLGRLMTSITAVLPDSSLSNAPR